jgi:hypothetical protein
MTIKTKTLSEKAMLVNFSISKWTGRVKDSEVSNEVVITKNADADAGTWWTYLVPKKALRDISRTAKQCRVTFHKYTMPWQDSGSRILPSACYLDYTAAMRVATAKYEKAVAAFIKEYPKTVANAKQRLGKLADNKPLPSAEALSSKFGHRTQVFPLPSVADFRVDGLGKEDIEDIKQQVEASINATTDKAMGSIWDRFSELVGKVEDTLSQPKKIFRDSLISNLSDFCTMIPKMNLTNDSKLEEMRKVVTKKLTKLRPDGLRDDKQKRKSGAKDAKDILKKLAEYGM